MALKTLNTLIKLHKRRIDILRRDMQALEEERRQLLLLTEQLRIEIEQEIMVTTSDAKIAGFFGAYSERIRKRQLAIAQEISRLDDAIKAKSEGIQTEFSEQKKFEIVLTQTEKRLAEDAKREQQKRFDEMGAQQYARTQEI